MERDSKDVVQKPAPYLRSGKGTESRQQASQSSRRYIPKGGFVIDFTTQPLPKGKGRAAPTGCHADVPREVLIARQQRAAARLSAPKYSAGNSPVTRKPELPDLEVPDHPKLWGASRCRAALKENIGPHLASSGHEKVATQPRASTQAAKTQVSRVIPRGALDAVQHSSETLDETDMFDDDAPLLSEIHLNSTPDAAHASVLTDPFQAGTECHARHSPVTSMYVQQLLSRETPAPESAVQKELLDLKDQITQAAAVLELEKQAFQRSRAEDETAWLEVTKREERRLRREKAILSRQSQVLLKLPSKREKAEVEALSAALEEERRFGRSKDARHKLTVQRLQRHVTQLQSKVADLEDEVRWHAMHAASAAQLPTRTRQLHSSSKGVSLKPEQHQTSKLMEGASPCHGAAKLEAMSHPGVEDNADCHQRAQLLPSRPATPEHLEQQLCSSEAMRKEGRPAAAGVLGLLQAMPAGEPADSRGALKNIQGSGSEQVTTTRNATAAHVSSSKAGSQPAAGNEAQTSGSSDRKGGTGAAPGTGRHHSARQKPSAVSCQIETVRSRKPAPANVPPARSQGVTVAQSALPGQPNLHDNNISHNNEGHRQSALVKTDNSVSAMTEAAPNSQNNVKSASKPTQRPKARTLPPLPDFMSLEAFRSASYSHDMPRMEALYAATDRVSAFLDQPKCQAEPAKIHHSSQMQDVEISGMGRPSPSFGAAGQSTLEGSACKEAKYESHVSRQHGTATQHDQALVSSDNSRHTLGAPLCTALHGKGEAAASDTTATGLCTPQRCSIKGSQEDSISKSRGFDRPVSQKMKSLDSAASNSCISADASDASSGVNDTETAAHDFAVQLSGCTAASADEYSSIKASLKSLQELLSNPQSPTLIREHTNDSKAGSSSVTSDAGKAYRRDSHSTAAASAQGDEQPMSRPDAHPQPTFRNTPELTQAVCGAPSYISQQPAQRNGFQHGDNHSELAELPDGGQGSAASSDNHPCRHHGKQDVSVGGVDGMDSQAAIPSNHTDGHTAVRFKNGDCKRSYTDGTVEYYYAKADTWHTTCPGDIEVYYFPTGQTEAHHPGGLKEIIFQDGSIRLVDSEGAESVAELERLGNAVRRSRPDWGTVADPSV